MMSSFYRKCIYSLSTMSTLFSLAIYIHVYSSIIYSIQYLFLHNILVIIISNVLVISHNWDVVFIEQYVWFSSAWWTSIPYQTFSSLTKRWTIVRIIRGLSFIQSEKRILPQQSGSNMNFWWIGKQFDEFNLMNFNWWILFSKFDEFVSTYHRHEACHSSHLWVAPA